MKQIIASVFFDILSYTIGNTIFCIFTNFELNLIIITARVYKLQLAEVNFISWLNFVLYTLNYSKLTLHPDDRSALIIHIQMLTAPIYTFLLCKISKEFQFDYKLFCIFNFFLNAMETYICKYTRKDLHPIQK